MEASASSLKEHPKRLHTSKVSSGVNRGLCLPVSQSETLFFVTFLSLPIRLKVSAKALANSSCVKPVLDRNIANEILISSELLTSKS